MNKYFKKVISVLLTSTCLLSTVACSAGVSSISLNNVIYPTEKEKTNYENTDFIDSVNTFGSKTAYKVLNGEENKSKNINYSPISLFFSLSMLASGANGETEKELMTLFDMDNKDKTYLSEECNKLFKSLYSDNKELKLLLADSLWMQNGITFKDEFINDVAKNFYASAYNIDNNSQSDVDGISDWVYENTNKLLNPKFKPSKDTVLRIVNTIYFKSSWEDEFESKNNYNDVFKANDKDIKCTYMNANFNTHRYIKGNNYTCSNLNMKSGSMYFILPNENYSVYDLITSENSIDDMMDHITDNANSNHCNVNFSIPKFTIKSDLNLNDYIKDLGCDSIFNNANFSDITDDELFVSAINQGTYMDVNEKGAEAAAYTSTECNMTGLIPSEPLDFKLDKPFIYILTADNGTILFVGICNNPLEN